MLKALATFACLMMPTVAMAQSPDLPSLWTCVSEARSACQSGVCGVAPGASRAEVDLVNWSYARCGQYCFGGQENRWSEDDFGNIVIQSETLPQTLVITPDDGFTELAYVNDTAIVSGGTCSPDARNRSKVSVTFIEAFEAFDDWQRAANAANQ
ncbi:MULTISPECIES: hypothetical protein [Brevundimonas]|uniref:hypothetical protein n=1 Tax=Brevundimonas TaxID=41275 RepID=UPI0025C27605|nr:MULTISPECIES: hypothetical protein [Brevundimonas]